MSVYAISLLYAGLWTFGPLPESVPGTGLAVAPAADWSHFSSPLLQRAARFAAPPTDSKAEPEAQPKVIPPSLLEEAELLFVQGRDAQVDVLIAITIDETGAVHEPEIMQSSNPQYDTAALDHIKTLRFAPATVDGQATPVRIQYGVRFFEQARSQIEGKIRGLELLEPEQVLELEIQPDDQRTTADRQSGEFFFGDLLAGSYEITIFVDGRRVESLAVEIQGDELLQLEIALPGSEAADTPNSSASQAEVSDTATAAPEGPEIAGPPSADPNNPERNSASSKVSGVSGVSGLPGDTSAQPPSSSGPGAPHDPTEGDVLDSQADDVATISASRLSVRQSSQTLSRDQALERAGTQGDVVAAARSQPGVGRAAPGKAELSLGGAVPQQSRLYVDNIPVPRLFHWGLARSILPASQVQSMRLQMVAFEANYGRAIGGSVWIRLEKPKLRRFRARIDASWLEAAAALNVPLGKNHAVSGSVRHSLQRQTLSTVLPKENSQLYPLADNFDYQVQSLHRIDDQKQFRLSAFGASSQQRLSRPSQDPSRAFGENKRDYFHRFALHYADERETQNTRAMVWAGFERARSRLAWGPSQAPKDRAGRGNQNYRGGFRLEHQHWLMDQISLNAGLDGEWDLNKLQQSGAPTLPPREGDIYIWGQPPGDRRAEDLWSLRRVFLAPYGSLQILLGSRWQLQPGLRAEWYATAGDRKLPQRPTEPAVGFMEVQSAVEPRLSLRFERSDYDHWQISGGLHHQAAAVDDVSPRFGHPRLGPQKAWQAQAGVELFPHPSVQAALSFFWNEQEDLVTRAIEPNPRMAQNLHNQGQGRNYGLQSQVAWRPLPPLSLEGHYTLLYAKKKDHPVLKFRRSDQEQRHQAQFMVATRWGKGFKASARAQLSSGFPRTPVVAAVGILGSSSFDPVYGAHNSIRLPLYFSSALQLSYTRTWGPEKQPYRLKLWLDIQNITNHGNVEEFYYSYDYRQRGELPGFPIFPTLGVSFEL